MTKFGIAAITASGLAAAVLGLASPAQAMLAQVDSTVISAGVDRLQWLDKIQPKATAPQVDNTVRHSGR
ncbi:hypothetical protein KL864_04570 [Mycolicibacterium goodii]|uniref:hypothetical protein n=1 Tax=Mycolicibacterium goodii TaxID=134601 RepID=UPI001BDC7D9E|nr:hypothetical protein [Mycolicibacterium goodii]MBU8815182.1 hypothetical protein [Mycolicibacterium goodii]